MKKRAVVIGGGASGMMCSIFLAKNGFETILFEKNEKLGKKIFITGKGRCNFTNTCDHEDFFDSVVRNSKFMYSSYYGFTNLDVIDFFENAGMKTKIERGKRAFPLSDHAYDVTDALRREMKKYGVRVRLNTKVLEIIKDDNEDAVNGVLIENLLDGSEEKIAADRVIVATGGKSYPSTGSTGDGYRFAARLGLKVTDTYPSLVSLLTKERFVHELAGLSLKNISFKLRSGKKNIYEGFGELLFTHRGISGPLVLTASTKVSSMLPGTTIDGYIDLKPAVSDKEFEARLIRTFSENPNKTVVNCLKGIYPSSLIPVIAGLSEIPDDTKANALTREMRGKIVENTKALKLTICDTGGFGEAVITRGGVDVRQINPSTMECKTVRGLYFIGEVLDVDALTGGFNLQVAWSTAHACGCAEE
ncbi:MAG: NAD(P)/FAD-dependent oxidoreductase [Lachnospiraceae bacterium]